MKFYFLLYNYIVFPLLFVAAYLLFPFNGKIRKGMKERRKLFENLIINLAGIDRSKKALWFHSSSMGEFEQAKPIIQKIKEEMDCYIVVSFFSPSGYDNSLRYPYADIVSYIPLDTPYRIKHFLNLVRPSLAVFMRYDIWPNVIWELNNRKIPSFIVDATMRKESKRKLPIAKGFHKSLYKSITKILCVSEEDKVNFNTFDVSENRVSVVGDTRFDRVYQKSLKAKERKLFKENFFDGKTVFVFGSSWESDEEVIFPAVEKIIKYDPNFVMIVAPHEPTVMHLEKIEHTFAKSTKTIRFSFMNNYNGERIIIIDSIGILLTLYYYADIAYVGGSFKQGIHNVLEPAVYGIPILFGPKIENSQEAQKLVELGSGFIVKNKKQAYRTLRKLSLNEVQRRSIGKISGDYVFSHIGATDKIIEEIKASLK